MEASLGLTGGHRVHNFWWLKKDFDFQIVGIGWGGGIASQEGVELVGLTRPMASKSLKITKRECGLVSEA